MSDTVTVEVDGAPIACDVDRPLLNAIQKAGVVIATACGGQGSCHLCRVIVTRGADVLPPANAIERKALGNILIAQGMRLSCQIPVEKPFAVTVPRRERGRKKKGPLSR